MYKLKIVVGAVALLMGGAVLAQDDGTAPALACTETASATEILDKQIREWRGTDLGKALDQRNHDGELVLIVGKPQGVTSGPSSAQFGKSRELAFAKAYLQAQADFVKQRRQQLETNTVSEFFSSEPSPDELSLDEGIEQGRLMRLGEKVFALTEAKLDTALREAGVADEDIKQTDPKKKIQTLKDSIVRTTTAKAFGEIAGLLPIQNFEATDCNNGAAVAVIAVSSQKNLSFAHDVRDGKPIVADPDQASEATLSAIVNDEVDSKEILDIYGLRKAHDQAGYPSLVSYGQWSFVSTGDTPRKREMKRKAALIQAESNAKAQIASYLNGSVQVREDTATEEIIEEFITVTRDEQTEASAENIIESQLTKISSQAKVQITGLHTLSTWSMEYPGTPGVQIVGTVVAWSPQFADAVNQATGSKKRQAVSNAVSSDASNTSGQVQVRSSKAKNNAADF